MMVGVEIAVRLYCLLPVEAYFSCRNVLFSQEIKKNWRDSRVPIAYQPYLGLSGNRWSIYFCSKQKTHRKTIETRVYTKNLRTILTRITKKKGRAVVSCNVKSCL